MNAAKTIAVAGSLVVGMLVSASGYTAGSETSVATATVPPKLNATIYVNNGNSVTAYAPGSNGNVSPIASIDDRTNMLEEPWGIALDSKANIYVANYGGGSNGIGTITVYAAGSDAETTPMATIAGLRTELENPFGIAVDSSGKIYVANFAGGHGAGSVTVYPAGSNGNVAPIATIAGDDTGLDNPSGIAIDSSGKIYVANRGGGRTSASSITVYAAGSNGNVKPIATITGPDTGLDDPCIAVDSRGKIYASNSSDSITVYPSGSNGDARPIAKIAGPFRGDKTGLSQPNGIALDSKGNIYAANATDSDFTITVYRAGSNGNVRPTATLGGPERGAQGVAVDSSGKIYVTTQFGIDLDYHEGSGGAVVVLSSLGKGEVETVATIYTAGKTKLDGESIALDSKGNVYIATSSSGSDNGSINVFAAGHYGNVPPIRTIRGDNTALHFPRAIAVDRGGNIYTPNMGDGRTTGSVTVYRTGSNGDAAPIATITGYNTLIQDLRAIAVDSSGNIYVSNCCSHSESAIVFQHGSNGNVAPFATIARNQINGTGRSMAIDSSGKLYAIVGSASGGAVIVYPVGSNGYATPIAVIDGTKTGLAGPQGITVDSNGNIYVVSDGLLYNGGAVAPFGVTSPRVTVYAAGSNGNVAPIATISGALTGLHEPKGIALGPPMRSP
jgi:sugar lactone lactonase YvrE